MTIRKPHSNLRGYAASQKTFAFCHSNETQDKLREQSKKGANPAALDGGETISEVRNAIRNE